MYRAIMTPLDGSSFGEQALPLAAELAAASGAALHLVHVDVIYPVLYVEGLPVIDAEVQSLSQAHARAYLDGVAERVRAARPDLRIVTHMLAPPIVASLAEYAESHLIDLIVMTTHGRGGLARAWLGSVADGLARHGPAPLLLLRPWPDNAPLTMDHFARIVIPLDGSPLAEQILEPALTFGRLTQAELVLLQVVMPFEERRLTPGIDLLKLEREINQRRASEAQAYLRSVAARLVAAGHTVEERVVFDRQPARAILKVAADLNPSLIAIATQGHGGLTRLLLGSVADKVVRGAETPVLLYRPRANVARHATAETASAGAN